MKSMVNNTECECSCHINSGRDWHDLCCSPAALLKVIVDIHLGVNTQMPSVGWEKEFESTLQNRMGMNNDALLRNEVPWIMDFIRTLIADQRTLAAKKEREKILAALPNLEPVPEDSGSTRAEGALYAFARGFNLALSIVRRRLDDSLGPEQTTK